ncbi:hypothetical protein AGMMS50218_06800 [Actinomycetota bacterium]|nr:hypothetical protein AGMMS50218_06800 [Actinomycetota bacterium]
MSAQQAVRVQRAMPRPARPVESLAPQSAPRLRLVRPPAQARTRVPFVLACMAILAVALISALLLNTNMARGAYERHDLESELSQLAQSEQDLSAQLDQRASAAQLAAAARALGMVPADSTAWLRLSDGTVQGAPGAAG